MKIGVALFAYKRTKVLKAVLDALKNNEGIDTLYIFQDGIADPLDSNEIGKWRETNQIIQQIDWCRTIVYVSEENKGLASSIVAGVNRVLEENDAAIILEDDCLPHVDFISFMKQCLIEYEKENRVYSVSGYAWPLDIAQPQDEDVYFCGRTSSWGWGTWRDRWEKFSFDYTLPKQLRAERELSERMGLWGNDLEAMLIGNIKGTADSWAAFWALTVIKERGYCINPYHSLVRHINCGEGGTHRTHNNVQDRLDTIELPSNRLANIRFPSRTEILPEIEKSFVQIGLMDAMKDLDVLGAKENVLLYGVGDFYRKHERYLQEHYRIVAYIDRQKHGFLYGKEIVKLGAIKRYDYDKIIVMLYDIGQCREVVMALAEQGVEPSKIIIGRENVKICSGGAE